MSVYFGQIDTYFVNVLSPKSYGNRRLMNINGSFGKAILWFYPEGSPLPNNTKMEDKSVFKVFYYLSNWEVILDVLRNESPVYFNFSDTSKAAQIYTGQEPVGEEET